MRPRSCWWGSRSASPFRCLQALTQIQEMTIAFVPKILAIFIALLLALPFMAEKLHAEMLRIAARIVSG